MVDVTLLVVWTQCVEHLVHARHGQGAHVENLCFTALEQTCSVCVCKHTHFAGESTKILRATTVDTDAFFNNALTNKLLGETANSFLDSLFLASKLAALATQLSNCFSSCCVCCSVAISLESNGDCLCKLWCCCGFHCCEHFIGVIKNWCVLKWCDWSTSCNHACEQLALKAN